MVAGCPPSCRRRSAPRRTGCEKRSSTFSAPRAASSTFVDLNPDALAAVRQNLAAVGLDDEPATVVRAALPGWLESAAAGSFDLALCDPPYDFEEWPAILGALRADVVVMESAAPIAVPEAWVIARERRYGGTLVTVAHCSGNGS